MTLVSILLSVVAFGCTVIGFLTTPIPVVGLVFSFGAAAIALGGIMLGGKARSVAKSRAQSTDAALIAVILNVLAFVPALMVAFTCGVCNAVMSSGDVHLQKNLNFGVGPGRLPGFGPDAGMAAEPSFEPSPDSPASSTDAGSARPSNALPPPPLPPGPRR